MTSRARQTFAKTILLVAALLGISAGAIAQDEIFAETLPVTLNPEDPDAREIGELIFRGGLEIAPGEENIGGISSIEWHEDRLYAVSDDGHWLSLEPDEFNGELIDILTVQRGQLRDERGKRLKGKENVDAEAIARGPMGNWFVAFERNHRILFYPSLDGPGTDVSSPDIAAALDLVAAAPANGGLETLDMNRDVMIACGEWARAGEVNCVHVSAGGTKRFELRAPPELAEHQGAPTDAACLDDGTCFVLFRSYQEGSDREGGGNRAAIVRLAPDADPETLAVFTPPTTLDNFEGLAVREQFGRTFLYIVSDNNFSDSQRTLLMKFEIKTYEPVIAPDPEPVIEYETLDVVLETEKGNITIRLETERAPITAANFLRYVDEGRFDGTNFYRALSFDIEPKPQGLIQGGTRYDPKRILPNITHEPTSETGLSHTNGAVTMARAGLGTANGDFSIMLGRQTSLDAKPDAADAGTRAGFAAFGYVIDGMDVVSAIQAGARKGSSKDALAQPVVIIKARRAPETAMEPETP